MNTVSVSLSKNVTSLERIASVCLIMCSSSSPWPCSQFNDEKQLWVFHQELEDVTEDQLSLASVHYMRSHYQEAIEVYEQIMIKNR